MKGEYDEEGKDRFWIKDIIGLRKFVVAEIGSKWGGGAVQLAKYASFVYAFEPDPTNYNIMRRFVGRSRFSERIKCYNMAVSDYDGFGFLNIPREDKRNTVNSESLGALNEKRIDVGKRDMPYGYRKRVLVKRLDSVAMIPSPDALIIDCEGSELEVLRGAKRLVSENCGVRLLIIETHHLAETGSTTRSVVFEKKSTLVFWEIEKIRSEPGTDLIMAIR